MRSSSIASAKSKGVIVSTVPYYAANTAEDRNNSLSSEKNVKNKKV
jgi:hypothetical protein